MFRRAAAGNVRAPRMAGPRGGASHRDLMHVIHQSRDERNADTADLRSQPARRLADLRAGESAYICGVEADPRIAKRLADLGFIGGTHIEMVRPGRPCIVRINGTRVGLGRRYQESVYVDLPGPS